LNIKKIKIKFIPLCFKGVKKLIIKSKFPKIKKPKIGYKVKILIPCTFILSALIFRYFFEKIIVNALPNKKNENNKI
tara:strand:+ start:406 stop:636 length:231 start_codon:yes stop_codon:yes gene_type:complete